MIQENDELVALEGRWLTYYLQIGCFFFGVVGLLFSCIIRVLDITYLENYLFVTGAPNLSPRLKRGNYKRCTQPELPAQTGPKHSKQPIQQILPCGSAAQIFPDALNTQQPCYLATMLHSIPVYLAIMLPSNRVTQQPCYLHKKDTNTLETSTVQQKIQDAKQNYQN